LLVFCRN